MRKLLLLLAFLSGASALHAANPLPHILLWTQDCPYTMIAGSRTLCGMTPHSSFTFTVNAATDVFTADATYTPANGDTFTTETTGTLPAGMYSMTGQAYPTYAVCSVSGQTFIVRQYACSGSSPVGVQTLVTDTGSGTHTAVLYNYTNNIYLDADPTGFPASTTFDYEAPASTSECNHAAPTSGGKVYSPTQGRLCIGITIPSGATPGTGTAHFTFCLSTSSTDCTTYDWPINVIAPPNIPYAPPSSFTSIPGGSRGTCDVSSASSGRRSCPIDARTPAG